MFSITCHRDVSTCKKKVMIRFPALNESLRSVSTSIQARSGVSINLSLVDECGGVVASSFDTQKGSMLIETIGTVLTSIVNEYRAVAKLVQDELVNVNLITEEMFASAGSLQVQNHESRILIVVCTDLKVHSGWSVEELIALVNIFQERLKLDLAPILSAGT